MYYSPVTPATGMSVLLQPQSSHTLSAERNSVSSSPLSTPSKRSSRNWYHRTSNRSVTNLAVGRLPNRLRGVSSIKELVRKTSRSILKQKSSHSRSTSLSRIELDQQHASVIHLPGSPKGPRCRPSVSEEQRLTCSSFDSLTPDQSGISTESSGPVTPSGGQAIQAPRVHGTHFRRLEMGNTESKLAGFQVGKAMLKGKRSRQTINLEESATSAYVPGRASQLPTELTSKQAFVETLGPVSTLVSEETKERTKEDISHIGPPPVLRHRASSGQVQVPRRRSSLTAIHLDSSHFEKPSSSTDSERGNRISSFSASFHPVISAPDPVILVSSLNVQGDTLDNTSFPHPLSPTSSQQQILSLNSSIPSPTPPKQTGIYFPQTWPYGSPEVKPAQLTLSHYECYRLHQPIRRERPMFNQVPCMTCGVDDKQQRYSCTWCELRICEGCMRQLDSIRGRSLTTLLEWVVNGKRIPFAEQNNESLSADGGETLKQGEGRKLSTGIKSAERLVPTAKSGETLKETESGRQSRSPSQNNDVSMDASNQTQLANTARDEWWSVRKENPPKEPALSAEQTDQTEDAQREERPMKEGDQTKRGADGLTIILTSGSKQDIAASSVPTSNGKSSWSRAKAAQMLRASRG